MKKKLIILTSILMLVALGISIAYFSGTIENIGGSLSVNSGKVTFAIDEEKVNANNLVPIYTEDYEDQAYKHTFTITRDNDSTLDACYELNLVIDSIGTNLRNQYLHYRLEYDNVSTEGTFNGKTNGDSITLITNQTSNSTNTTKTYTLYIWLEYSDSVDQTSILTGNASSRTLTSHLEISGGIDSCISEEIPLTAYKYNNQDADISYSTLYNALGTEYNASVSCINGSVYTYSNGSITLDTLVVPDRCTIYFTDKTYEVDITCNNCTSSPSTDIVLYNESPTFNITPESAYTLEGATVNCSNNQSGTINESTGVVTVSNVTSDTVCTISPVLNQFTVTGSAVGSGSVTSSANIIYGQTTSLTVSPSAGYYLSAGSCDHDYTITNMTIGDNVAGQGEQTVTINNNSKKSDSTCTFTFTARSFTVTGATNNSSYGTVTSSTITYGSTTTLTVSPSTGYYLSAGSCNTSGYTITNMTTGNNTTGRGSQTVTINNNSTIGDTTCTVTFSPATYTGTRKYLCPNGTYQDSSSCTAASVSRTRTRTRSCDEALSCEITQNDSVYKRWIGTYSCENSTGKLIGCTHYSSGTDCDTSTPCWRPKSYMVNPSYECSTTISSAQGNLPGGAMDKTISCSCPKYYSSSISDSYGTAGSCANGYSSGSFSGTCTPGGSSGASCSSNATCSTTQYATCTATGTEKWYCSSSNTYQDDSTCYY